jgi:hypothetical protein
MAQPASIYEQLTGVKISDATVSQLDFTKNTFIDANSIGWWKGPITISKVMEASRTYAGGTLPIPETGDIVQVAIAGGADGTLQPSGTELWEIKAIYAVATGGSATCRLSYFDGSSPVPFNSGISVAQSGTIIDLNNTGPPLILSNSLYLQFEETGGANAVTFFIAYFKVSL